MLIERTLDQGTQEWLEWRRGGITATEASCAIGASQFGSALDVYNDKLRPKPHVVSEYEEWGSLLEDVIKFKKFAAVHPEFEVRQGACYEDGWKRCSLDGQLYQDGKCVAILEIKTGSNESKWDPIPPGYVAQVQWQMHVTGIHKAYFAVLIQGHNYFERQLDYDPKYCAKLEAACLDLWHCICAQTPPAANPERKGDDEQKALAEAAAAVPVKDDTYELSDEEYAAFVILRDKAAEFEEKLKRQKLLLTGYLVKAKYLTHGGVTVASLVSAKGKESIDIATLKSKYPDIYEAVRRRGNPYSYAKFG